MSADESRPVSRDSAKKLGRNSSESHTQNYSYNLGVPYAESKASTPRRGIPLSASKKSILKSSEKAERERDYENYRGSDKSARKSSMTEQEIRGSMGHRISIQSLLTPNESSSKLYNLPGNELLGPHHKVDFKLTPKPEDSSFSVLQGSTANNSKFVSNSGPSSAEISR